MIKDFKIAMGKSVEQLEEAVWVLQNEGYEPWGGVAIDARSATPYIQAMIQIEGTDNTGPK